MHGPIERIDKPRRDVFVRDYVLRNRPVIIRGVVDRWPAFSKWTPEYFQAVAGDHSVELHYNDEASFTDWYVHREKRVDEWIPFGDAVEMWSRDPESRRYYMTEYKLRLVSPALLADVDFGDYFEPARERYEPMLFLGRDTCMPLHYHRKEEAFLCQIAGRKRITLYPPDQYSNLYPGAWYRPFPLFSRIQGRAIHADRVDLAAFPRFARARSVELELHPGEMLFIPVHWWHLTAVEGYQVSVSHFFRAKLRCWTFPRPGFPVIAREARDLVVAGVRRIRSTLGARAPARDRAEASV